VGANGRIAPENISLNGGWKPIDVNEPVGVSIHQDLGRVLVSTMPGRSWMIESDLRRGIFTLVGQPADRGHQVRVEVGIPLTQAVRSVARWWRTISEPVLISPSHGRKIFDIPEPEGPLDENDDVPIIPKCVLIHLFPPIQEVNNIEADKQREQARKRSQDRIELECADFLGHKADRDTDGKFAYGQTRLPDGMLGNQEKAIKVAQAIQEITAKAKHRE
jgi:hypothetical protein